uniref:Peptidase S1 domain-containing protein n=1 Tax=Anopheles atroparvus TaxID=41427 RepID=A0A8W7NYL2_ANOAO
MVGLRVNGYEICGGSIITNKHVLTAAHCLESNPNPSTVSVRGGSTFRSSCGVIFLVSSYVLHPNYNTQTTDFDAAVVTISGSFAGLQSIATIALQESDIAPTWCYALGWGYTNGATKTLPDKLQFVWLQLQTNSNCVNTWGSSITPQMVCAQYNNYDVCNGDSGGPLVCNGRLTGIVSFGATGCPGKFPSIFAKVASSSILSFIRSNTSS